MPVILGVNSLLYMFENDFDTQNDTQDDTQDRHMRVRCTYSKGTILKQMGKTNNLFE